MARSSLGEVSPLLDVLRARLLVVLLVRSLLQGRQALALLVLRTAASELQAMWRHRRGLTVGTALPSDRETWSREMGIDWMDSNELAAAIPPAYTELIGHQLLQHIRATPVLASAGKEGR